jgi:hypothetical protein
MKRVRLAAAIFLMPALGIFTLGCGSSEDSTRDMPSPTKVTKKSSSSSSGRDKASPAGAAAGGGGGGAAAGATELESTGSGTLKGTITYDGNPPSPSPVKMEKDTEVCTKTDPKKLQVWEVGPNKGVANVIVWLRAPKGKCFKIPDDMKQWKGDPVKIDQPLCAFEPRVVALYPSYYDPQSKQQKPSGQKFIVANSAPKITHNTNVAPGNTLINSGSNNILNTNAKQEMVFRPSKPNQAGGEQSLTFTCNIHPWMKGYAMVFDHPFEFVTKEDGAYEIKNAPAGVDLELVIWHESMSRPEVKETIKLKDKETLTKDFKIK